MFWVSAADSPRTRVCQVTTASRPFDTRVFSRECRTLAQRGYDVVLIIEHDQPETVHGVRIVPLRHAANRPVRVFLRTWTALRLALREKADIYHVHDPELILVGMLLRVLTRRPVIYGVREDYPRLAHYKNYLPRWVRPVIGFAVRALEQTASHALDAVVAVTLDIASNFARHRRTILVRNYPVLPEQPLRPPTAKPPGQPFTMIYVGELTAIRGVFEMVEAIERLSARIPTRLLLAGTFEDPELEAALRKRGAKHTEFLGYVDIRDNPDLLRRADVGLVCLHPKRHHVTSLPLKIFDYMMAGLPVIASDFPLWREIVVGSGAGLCVDPLKPDAIAEAAFRLSANADERLAMGRRGQLAVCQRFNWQQESQRLLELYGTLLGSSRDQPRMISVAGR
jgi:glycosyltransferase involved in cell wall biosynthesis